MQVNLDVMQHMISVDTSELELPWTALEDGSSDLVAELRREVALGHVLFERKNIRAIAKREDCDDVLFGVENLLAVVHLTWSSRENNPRWPHTELHGSWAEFLSERMHKDVVDYAGGAD